MRRQFSKIFFIPALVVIFCACSVQPRVYRKGYYVSFKTSRPSGPVSVAKKRPAESPGSVAHTNSPNVPHVMAAAETSLSVLQFAGIEKLPVAGGDVPALFSKDIADRYVEKSIRIGADKEQKKKVHVPGLLAFALSIGAWFLPTYVALAVFVIAALLALYSVNRIAKDPGRYQLKTLSLIALILSCIGVAVSVFTIVVILFS